MNNSQIVCMYLLGLLLGVDTINAKPNIILLVADDLGYGELGCQGNDDIPTPHIDSIASNGVRFSQGYVTAAYCSASRAGFLTGRYQTRFGHEFNPTGHHNEDPIAGLPLGEETLADVLTNSGYITGLIGKWHLGGHAKYHPLRRGFDEFYGFLHEGHYFVPPPYDRVTTWLRRRVLPGGGKGRWTSPDGKLIYSTHLPFEPDYDANNPILRNGQPIEEKEYLTDALTREAVDFIERNHSAPFFLYVPYNAVHSPMQASDAYMKKFAHIEDVQRRIFAGMLANMDDSIGAILAKLRDLDLEENTLIFFFSDNGGPTLELTSSNLPLNGGKGSFYEGGIRVPFMMQWRGKIPQGMVYENPVISLDVFMTSTAAAGSNLSSNKKYDGVDLLPYLKEDSKAKPHEVLYWRQGKKAALRSGNWKIHRDFRTMKWRLRNLSEDLEESKPEQSEKDPDKLKELVNIWESMNSQMQEPVWSRD